MFMVNFCPAEKIMPSNVVVINNIKPVCNIESTSLHKVEETSSISSIEALVRSKY